MPALFARTSRWPKVSHASRATRSASSRSPRSAVHMRALGEVFWQSASTSSRRAVRRATRPTVMRRAARARARAAPIPDDAPVTRTVEPSSSFISSPGLRHRLLHGLQEVVGRHAHEGVGLVYVVGLEDGSDALAQ